MELIRKIDNYLEDFFSEERHNALLITGSRQCGKTHAIRKFCKKHFKNIIEINFLQNKKMVSIFSNAKDHIDVLLKLPLITDEKIEKGNTVIFFDEVQECPNIVTLIKFLVEEGSYSYILSTSHLSRFMLKTSESNLPSGSALPIGVLIGIQATRRLSLVASRSGLT